MGRIAILMSNGIYYSDVKTIKKSLKIRVKKYLIIFFVFGIFVGCFFIAKYMSSALTVGNLGAYIVYGGTNLKIEPSRMYAVTLGEFDSQKEAESVSFGSTIRGASGFVWEDKKYYVIGNIYSTYTDAEKVAENLKDSNYSVAIKEIDFPKVSIDFSDFENEDMSTINKDIKVFDDVYKQLYAYSISFDKSEMNNLAISSKLSSIRGDIKSLISETQVLLNNPNSNLQAIQNSLIRLDELLDKTTIKTIDNSATNYSLKYAIAQSVRIKYDLFKTFK